MTTPTCVDSFDVKHSGVSMTDDFIEADYVYQSTRVDQSGPRPRVSPVKTAYKFRTKRRVNKTGVLLVGIGGNNGSTFCASIFANKHRMTWRAKEGLMKSNYFGSITHASTTYLGVDSETHREVYAPLSALLPMVNANDLIVGGWDINDLPLDEAVARSGVLPYNLQKQVAPYLKKMGKPMKSIYYPDFIASNQYDRANNIYPGTHACKVHLDHLRKDIRSFKDRHSLDTVIVLWTGNTERYCDIMKGVHDSEASLMHAINEGHSEISPSTVFGMAALLEGAHFINGSPQNSNVPGLIKMAESRGLFIAGDDFKSGQTKLKSVMVDFLVTAGLKPESIVSYNHLGNNDGKNLAEAKQFRSKEISKSNVVDDMVNSNSILYNQKEGEKPDHCVVIKYVPRVGDSKRAMDEYMARIFMNGTQTFAIHNVCEDSLLAVPIMIDLVVLTELCSRIQWKTDKFSDKWNSFESVLTLLSFLLKAPLVPESSPLVNALFKQRACIDNVLRACVGLPPINDMNLEYKTVLKSKL